MQRKSVPYDHKLTQTLARLESPGLLLASTKGSGESNVMTIGWATVGVIWGKPVFVVLVRPSRFTYEFIEDSGAFSVNVPSLDQKRWAAFCGSRSGRNVDKFAELGIATSRGQQVEAVTLDDCPMVYECRVVHTNDLIPANLAPEIEAGSYGGSDYHRLYYGEIVGAYASDTY
jgi:flavin reductase (DIM6/NTAB) family NADH-FMN oxidoreductase RutF